MAEGARLESVFTRKGNVGSNPTLSARSGEIHLSTILNRTIPPISQKAQIVTDMMDLSSGENYVVALPKSRAISRRWIFRFRLPRSNVQPATHGELRPQNETGYPPRARLCAASGARPRFAC